MRKSATDDSQQNWAAQKPSLATNISPSIHKTKLENTIAVLFPGFGVEFLTNEIDVN